MTSLRPNRKPTFFWQGLLIVLPIVVLAAVGFFSLRQDKLLARHDAAERAQTVADDLVPKIWSQLTSADAAARFQHHAFQVDNAGQLIFPPPRVPDPVPKPLALSSLNPGQAKLWLEAQKANADERDPAAVQALRDFIASNPPENFAAAASYSLGLLLVKQRKDDAAAQMFAVVFEKFPAVLGASGLPLAPFAQLKLLELGSSTTNRTRPRALFSP